MKLPRKERPQHPLLSLPVPQPPQQKGVFSHSQPASIFLAKTKRVSSHLAALNGRQLLSISSITTSFLEGHHPLFSRSATPNPLSFSSLTAFKKTLSLLDTLCVDPALQCPRLPPLRRFEYTLVLISSNIYQIFGVSGLFGLRNSKQRKEK